MKLKKGSAAAKAFMAKIRAKKGATKKVGAYKKPKKLTTTKKIGSNLNSVEVIFENPKYNYTTDVSSSTTEASAKKYFVGKFFNVGIYPKENLQKCIGIKFNNGKIVSGWKKGNTRFIEKGEKPFKTKKNIIVSRRKVNDPKGTFFDFKTLKNTSLLSGYAPQKEIIIGKVSTERKLKDLAPQVKIRITRGKAVDTIAINNAKISVDIFKKFITKNMIETQEFFAVMYLNNANKCLGVYIVGQGGFTAVVTEARLIMSGALLIGCTGFILCHNHPSGNLTPSAADRQVTKSISDLAKQHDIRVVDHVIITNESYYSFAENGMI